jgi:hypothetical protein
MWIEKISSFSILVPLLLGAVFFFRFGFLQKSFFAFIIFSAIFDGFVAYAYYMKQENLWMFKVFLVCDFFFFLWFFNKIVRFPKWKWVYASLIIPVLIFNETYINCHYGKENSTSMFYLLVSVFNIIQSGFIIVCIFEDFEINILNNYVFWISMARLFYYLTIVFIFVYPNFVENGFYNEFYGEVNFAINATANTILNILYGVSFICLKVKK